MHKEYLIERTLSGVVFVLLLLWTFALFVHVPYAGFDFHPSYGRITAVYDASQKGVQVGDQLLQVGDITWEAFKSDFRQPLLINQQPGQVVPLRLRRGEEEFSYAWVYPGFTKKELGIRLASEWILAFVFWFVGVLIQLFLRPKNERWWLLSLFHFLAALWLAGGGTLSRWHVWEGSTKLGVFMWLGVPVSLHLHWVFPKPLGQTPSYLWWLLYLMGILAAIGEVFQLLPPSIYLLGFLVAVGGSIFFLLLHFWHQPDKRREIGLLVAGATLALLPAVGLGIGYILGSLPLGTEFFLLSLPALPFAYFYAAARHQLGELELRANRLVSLYVFLILLSTVIAILLSVIHAWLPVDPYTAGLMVAFLTAFITVTGFTRFERLFERHILGIPLAKEQLLESYATQITTSLDETSLLMLLHEQILPSLLVRQAVLSSIDEGGNTTVLGVMGLDEHQLPTDDEYQELLTQKGRIRIKYLPRHYSWVHVILPLQVGERTIGLWLLGRRDPDDFYAQAEIVTLQAIANQTAIALANITNTKELRTLYQSSIDRQESERTRLGRELHDVILNQLAHLYRSVEDELERFSAHSTQIEDNYYLIAENIRGIVKGLRPPMLSYGLRTALDELVDDLEERHLDDGPLWELDLSRQDIRYPPSVEQHLFRIVQQACENTLRHAQANTIWLTSRLTPTKISLSIVDDGKGFEVGQILDLTYLLTHKHFGLVGMLERSKLIGADLKIESVPNKGTRVLLTWQPEHPVPYNRPSEWLI